MSSSKQESQKVEMSSDKQESEKVEMSSDKQPIAPHRHFLSDKQKDEFCNSTSASIVNIEISVDEKVARAFTSSNEAINLYSTGFILETEDKTKLRILTSFRAMEKFHESVVKTFGDFTLESINKAFEFAFLCTHIENKCRQENSKYRNYEPIKALDVDLLKSMVLLEVDVNEMGQCEDTHPGIKIGRSRPSKEDKLLFRAWPALSPGVMVWSYLSNHVDRQYTDLFEPGGSYQVDMNLSEFNMNWTTSVDETFEDYAGGPVLDLEGDCVGLFYGIKDGFGYAATLEEVKNFVQRKLTI